MFSTRTGGPRAAFTVALLVVLVVSSFGLIATVGAPGSTGKAPATPSTTGAIPGADLPNAPAVIKGLTAPAPLTPSEQATENSIRATLNAAPTNKPALPTLDEMLAAYVEAVPADKQQFSPAEIGAAYNANLHEALSCGDACRLLSIGGVAVFIGVVCAATGVESLGLGCLAAVAIGVIILGIEYFLGLNAANAAAEAANTAGQAIIHAYQLAMFTLAGSRVEIQSLINLTVQAFGYAAAAAALLQIGNATWNGPLDIVQSGIASNLSAEVAGFGLQEAAIWASTLSSFSITLGDSDSSGYGCELLGGTNYGNTTITAGAATATCGAATSGSFAEPYGTVSSGFPFATGADVGGVLYIAKGAEVWGSQTASQGSTTLWSPLSNKTVTISTWTKNFTMPAGDEWRINATSNAYSTIICEVCMALNLGTKIGTQGTQFDPSFPLQFNAATNNIGVAGEVSIGGGGVRIASNGEAGACSSYGDLIAVTYFACPADNYLGTGSALGQDELFAFTAQGIGQTYWQFLHLLGYFSVGAIPARCIIPTPNTVLQGVPYTELEGQNTTFLFNLYLTYLNQLGFTYNATSYVLNSTTFCHHPLPVPSGNLTGQFNVYGLGYIYLNGTGIENANGTAVQSINNPETWNVSGEIFVQPALYNMSVPVNTTWYLSSKQGAWAFVIPLINTTTGQTVATGPTNCAVNGGNKTDPCGTPFIAASYYLGAIGGGLFGNSTLKGGGTVKGPLNKPGENDAVFFTECWTNAGNLTAPNFKTSTTCGFGVGGITPPPPPCDPSKQTCGGGGGLGGGIGCSSGIFFWSSLVNDFASVTGSSGLGCLLAEAFAIIFLVIIAVIVIALVAWAVRRY